MGYSIRQESVLRLLAALGGRGKPDMPAIPSRRSPAPRPRSPA